MSSLPVISQMFHILESLEVSVMFFKRDLSLLNLLLKYIKDFCLNMTQTHAYIIFSTRQYDFDIVDDEEAPYEALQRMAIGDVRHKI
jgi:hypothetical protein